MKFWQKPLFSVRQEAAFKKTLSNLRAARRGRFRILACIDGTEEGFISVRKAARFGASDECDIVVLYVRPIDQGLHSGGLQVRLARQNMLDSGFELPGVSHLKRAVAILKAEGLDISNWQREVVNQNAWGDPAGDNKIEYRAASGRSVVLKLKTAPDVATGILDQYELGPYNLIIMGEPSRWRSEFQSFFGAGIVQSVATLAPCSVMVARKANERMGFLICIDGTTRALNAARQAAVLAQSMQRDISLLGFGDMAQQALSEGKEMLAGLSVLIKNQIVEAGEPISTIIRHGNSYGTIVVCDEAKGHLQRLWRGSVATEVVRRAITSVLEVR